VPNAATKPARNIFDVSALASFMMWLPNASPDVGTDELKE